MEKFERDIYGSGHFSLVTCSETLIPTKVSDIEWYQRLPQHRRGASTQTAPVVAGALIDLFGSRSFDSLQVGKRSQTQTFSS